MLNLEWVTKKLLPSIIAREPIGKKKKPPQPTDEASTSSPPRLATTSTAAEDGSPSPSRPQPQNMSNSREPAAVEENTDPAAPQLANPYAGPNPASVVPPHIFVAILDEALAILQPPSSSGAHASPSCAPSAFQEVFVDDLEDSIEEDEQPKPQEEQEGVQKQQHQQQHVQRAVIVGPTRGHSVPLARLLMSWLQPHIAHGAPLPSFVFLGNYIDSGPCSVECLAIVLSLLVGFHRLKTQHQQGTVASSGAGPVGGGAAAAAAATTVGNRWLSSQPTSQVSSAVVSPALHPLVEGKQQQLLPAQQWDASQTAASAAAVVPPAAVITPTDLGSRSSAGAPPTPMALPAASSPSSLLPPPPTGVVDGAAAAAATSSSSAAGAARHSPTASGPPPPSCVLLRGRHEAGFPVAVKYTGSPLAGYRRLDDELSTVFTSDLDNTPRSLAAALGKLQAVFAWMPCAAMVRCRLRSGEHNAFLCCPGGPSPGLLRYSSLREMKTAVEAAAFRALRAPLLQAKYEQQQQRQKVKQLYPAKTFADEQLLRDIATAEPYEDDEDRAATTAGILFSDNPDQGRDNPAGTCCFSTEAAATLLARCGAQTLVRASGFPLQKVTVRRPKKGAGSSGSVSPSSAAEPSPNSPTSPMHSADFISSSSSTSTAAAAGSTSAATGKSDAASSISEMTTVTGRPRGSPYDPGYRMYRLPSHVKRAVQSGGMPGSQASPLMSPKAGSVVDLSALDDADVDADADEGEDSGVNNLPAGGGSQHNSSGGANVPSAQLSSGSLDNLSGSGSFGRVHDRNGCGASGAAGEELSESMMMLSQQHHQKRRGGRKAQQKATNPSPSFPPLPQVISLFSAPHFGNNFKSRNLGCIATIQCKEQQRPSSLPTTVVAATPASDQHSVLVSMMQFDDSEPLLFTPSEPAEKRLHDLALEQQQQQQEGEEQQHVSFKLDTSVVSVAAKSSEQHEQQQQQRKDDAAEDAVGEAAQKKPSPYDSVKLDERDISFLRRVKRMCNTLKDRGQLQLLVAKHKTVVQEHLQREQE